MACVLGLIAARFGPIRSAFWVKTQNVLYRNARRFVWKRKSFCIEMQGSVS
jgi:hypothetical protein